MTKSKRTSIPKRIREAVLKEYNNLCAVCATVNPQLHHIDENPANNALLNLLPLCPNCHLSDQHNPTSQIDPKRLALFRRYKDPFILAPQFTPLFRRMQFLLDGQPDKETESAGKALDLFDFVNALRMGDYYAKTLSICLQLIHKNVNPATHPDGKFATITVQLAFLNASKAVDLLIELLPFQEWPRPENWNKAR